MSDVCETCKGKRYVYEGEAITGCGHDDVFPEKVACDECGGTGQRPAAERVRNLLPDRMFETLLSKLRIHFAQMEDYQRVTISHGEIKTLFAGIELLQRRRDEQRGEWQPIETAAGVMLGIKTSIDQYTSEHDWDQVAAEAGDAFEEVVWWLFCFDGAERVEGNEIPTHWMPKPQQPAPYTPRQP
jgi:hypothetical protein